MTVTLFSSKLWIVELCTMPRLPIEAGLITSFEFGRMHDVCLGVEFLVRSGRKTSRRSFRELSPLIVASASWSSW